MTDALERIKQAVGPRGWSSDPDELAPFLAEARGLYRGTASFMARPASTEEVAAVVAICAEAGMPVVPQGGNTGLCGGAVAEAGSVLLSLTRMSRVREVDALNYTMTVEAGCILADVQQAAAAQDRLFPLSLAAEGSCRIGGNLSTNAGGTAVLRYGNTRDLVLGVEVVLPDGRVWNGLRRLRKDNTGYDLRHLFIGAEGTLGVITAAVLKLFPRPRDVATAVVALPDADAAIALLARARGETGDSVTAFEYMNRFCVDMSVRHGQGVVDPLSKPHPGYALIELTSPRADAGLTQALEECLGAAAEAGLVRDAVIAQSQAQAKALWRIREQISEVQQHEGGSIKHDVSVPVSRVAAFIAEASARIEAAIPGIRVAAFGHVGDGNVHYNLSQPVGADKAAFLAQWANCNRIVHDVVKSLDGSFSAEHGIGQLRAGEMLHYKSPVELDLMRRVKAALDPAGLMNPGKVLLPG